MIESPKAFSTVPMNTTPLPYGLSETSEMDSIEEKGFVDIHERKETQETAAASSPPVDLMTMDDDHLVRQGRLRLDIFLLGFLMLMFIHLQFDRTNLGNALTDGFATRLHMAQAQINIGQTLFTLAIFLFEIPSNLILRHVGAHRWLPSIMFVWGTVTWCQMFLRDRKAFYATRFLLAAAEAGFIPGAAYFLGRFYVRGEMGLRYALLWSANSIAGALSGVLALGLLELNGRNGLFGWQYLFLAEGVMTCFVALVAFFYLPTSILGASRWRWAPSKKILPAILTAAQAEALSARVLADDASKDAASGQQGVRWADFDCFLNWRLPGHCIMAFLTSVMFQPINTYAPSIIKSLGYKGYTANGLNSVGSCCALVVSLGLAFSSDRRKERGLHVLAGFLLSAVGLLWLSLAPDGTAKGVLYGGVIVTQAGMGSVQGINAAWLANMLDERQRPVALAAYAMSIQLAGFVGSNLFHAKDAPRYKHGLLICAACVLAASALCIVYTALYFIEGKRRQAKRRRAVEHS